MDDYKTIATINSEHNIFLVMHEPTRKIYIKKILEIYNRSVYDYLLNNPIKNVPRIMDVYEEDNHLTVIEEYISGETLQDKINYGMLSLKDIFKYTYDLCLILESLHSLEPPVIHRDIKPSNVIISNCGCTYLIDFNAAKYYSDKATTDTVLLGTSGYAAPEQYGFGASTIQTDIYSLGILLGNLLDCIEVTPDNKNCINRLKTIINTATQIDHTKRYKSVSDLCHELKKCDIFRKKEKEPLRHDFSNIIPDKIKRFILPGYRTCTPYKMLFATLYYIFIVWMCVAMTFEKATVPQAVTMRIIIFCLSLSVVFGSFNYLNLYNLMPLCKSDNIFIRLLGILLLDLLLVVIIFFFGIIAYSCV
ncbi:MAG: protein kinase [Lachnospira sp.]